MPGGGKACELFLDLAELKSLDSSNIHSCLILCLERHKLTIEKLEEKLNIGLASDGASTMTGVHRTQSPKNQRELEAAANDVGVQLLRVGQMFDVFQAVKAIWRDFPALSKHLGDSALSSGGRDKAKLSGLEKMTTYMLVAELAPLKDCLRELKSLSLLFQSCNAQITEYYTRIRITLVTIQIIKDKGGQNYTKFIPEFEEKGSFRGVYL